MESDGATHSPVPNDKRAVVFGVAGGSIGAAVARKFQVPKAPRFPRRPDRGALSLPSPGRSPSLAAGPATRSSTPSTTARLTKYLDRVVKQAGGIDIEFNATGPRITECGNGKPAVDLPVAEFTVAQTVLTSQFITARGAARRMVRRVPASSSSSPAARHAMSRRFRDQRRLIGASRSLMRAMALELTGTGIRVVCLRTAANPDTRTIRTPPTPSAR